VHKAAPLSALQWWWEQEFESVGIWTMKMPQAGKCRYFLNFIFLSRHFTTSRQKVYESASTGNLHFMRVSCDFNYEFILLGVSCISSLSCYLHRCYVLSKLALHTGCLTSEEAEIRALPPSHPLQENINLKPLTGKSRKYFVGVCFG